jgi:chorismate dehydratase
MYKISVVSYLNSKVFIKGLEQDPIFDFRLDVPAECARKLRDNEVDIGLIPVATIPEIPNANIISDFCISAFGKVNSVFLFSNVPVENIKKIYLDNHSRTSNKLCKFLIEKHWQIDVEWFNRSTDLIDIHDSEAFILIGDRTFDLINQYKYQYDLAEEWRKYNGLPFVFAAWVANKEIDKDFIQKFNHALSNGIHKINDVISENLLINFDVNDYLKNKIQYHLNDDKHKAINLFLDTL